MKRASGELDLSAGDSSAIPPSAEATEDREAAVKRAKTFLEQPDAVLEPDAPRQIRKYVLGSATSAKSGEERRIVATKVAQTVIETLCKNFQHYPAMCEMLSKWIAKLQPNEDSMSIILKCFKKQSAIFFPLATFPNKPRGSRVMHRLGDLPTHISCSRRWNFNRTINPEINSQWTSRRTF